MRSAILAIWLLLRSKTPDGSRQVVVGCFLLEWEHEDQHSRPMAVVLSGLGREYKRNMGRMLAIRGEVESKYRANKQAIERG
jgi:hypothetical protein